jgi:hypothetical protein
MRRKVMIGLAACAAMALFAVGTAQIAAGEPVDPQTVHIMQSYGVPLQPDTHSSKWKPISDDLAMWVETSEQFGMRGRLYVRLGPLWYPVAVDGPADLRNPIFVR